VVSIKPNVGATKIEASNAISALFTENSEKIITPVKNFMESINEINENQVTPTSLNEETIKKIIFDISEIEYLSSAAYTSIIKAHNLLTQKNTGKNTIVLNPSVHVEQLIKTTQTDNIISIRKGELNAVIEDLQSNGE